jgi:hypothetical protein
MESLQLASKNGLPAASSAVALDKGATLTGIRWFEVPLLFYFMAHFFPPMPSGIANLCLALGAVGVLWECRIEHWRRLERLRHPLVLGWVGLVALLAISLLQVPEDLLRESWRYFSKDLLKHSLFALVILLYLDTSDRARRVLLAGTLACALMLVFCLTEIVAMTWKTGRLPFQRDYLFYLMFFFPFLLVTYRFDSRWRFLCFALATATIALAFLMGFRGAVLALLVMSLIFSVFARIWSVLFFGAVIAAAGLAIFFYWFPDQAAYVLAKFQQTGSSARVSGHWLPAWDMSMQAPWLGHGFGHHLFSYQFGLQMDSHPLWARYWSEQLGWLPRSPHSVVFETLFMAGWPALLLLGTIVGAIIFSLGKMVWRWRESVFSSSWLSLALAVFIALIGNFLVFYQTEDPSWRTAPIAVMLAVSCLLALRDVGDGADCG